MGSGFATLGAAEVRSAEATELPVWERPPASVANGFCHPWALDPGSRGSRRYARIRGADWRGLGLWGAVLGFCACFGLDACPCSVLLIRVNLCNLWMFLNNQPAWKRTTPDKGCLRFMIDKQIASNFVGGREKLWEFADADTIQRDTGL